MQTDLKKLAEATLSSPHRVVKVAWGDRFVWIKKSASDKSFFQRLLGRSCDLRQEAEHIEQFRAAGFAAPEMLAISDDWIVLEDLGTILDTEMKTMQDPAPEKLSKAACDCAIAIAQMHKAHLSHGRCKLNDLVRLQDGGIGFIDFEESADHVPLPRRQAREIFFFSMSLARYMPLCPDIIKEAFVAYRRVYGAPEVFAELQKLLKKLRPLAVMFMPFRKLLRGDPARAYEATRELLFLAENRV